MKRASKCKPCPMYSGRDQAGKAWAVCPYSGGFVRHTSITEQKASSQPDGATGREGSARRPAQTIPAHSRQFWRVYMGFAVNRFIRPFLAFLTFPKYPNTSQPTKAREVALKAVYRPAHTSQPSRFYWQNYHNNNIYNYAQK